MTTSKINCVIIGDKSVGKTTALMVYSQKEFPKNDIPMTCEKIDVDVSNDKTEAILSLFDYSGKEHLNELDSNDLNVDVFLIMFSTVDRDSFENIKTKWFQEIRKKDLQTPIVLIGTKIDLRNDPNYLQDHEIEPITKEEGTKLAKELGAIDYQEISSLSLENIDNLFRSSISSGLKRKIANSKKENCLIL
ncbi:rho-related protein racd-related [Anaeramoeba ignava]|uniref:Rho-related protein racd-related n=1 Tax=Anaeramoeba ignava TaxID=1746090 RepID=A0A9Q0LER1_ANAIG|nr:rho-related protein racd-related [Anaeramoeba ignava]|eukprot:Anaeramoba_ignava/a107297_17.p1 GENE.a107297_17~~a107297_17.p1  ORF type:complete len:191 (+),score=70.81 a107297_17:142-714(+)